MVCNTNPCEYLPALIELETEGERSPAQTFNGEALVNLGGIVLVTRETAEALLSEAA